MIKGVSLDRLKKTWVSILSRKKTANKQNYLPRSNTTNTADLVEGSIGSKNLADDYLFAFYQNRNVYQLDK